MQEYIRIDEAVKKYGKTRQTFYNYINKGILEVKKLNNRLFLDTRAIEHLMTTSLDDTIFEHKNSKEMPEQIQVWLFQEQLDTIEDLIQTSYTTRLESLQSTIENHIIQIKQEILYDLKNILWVQLNYVITAQNSQLLKFDHFDDKMHHLSTRLSRIQLSNRKILFYGAILLSILLNYILTSIL